MAEKKARVLRAIEVEGVTYSPDSVIKADADVVKALEASGAVDSNVAAVKFCESAASEKAGE